MSLSSEEVNFLIYRYLLESGFIHSAFAFGHESLIAKSSIDGTKVVPGALISFIQKGLQFVEIETHVNADGTETVCDSSFSVVSSHQCNIKSKRRIIDPYGSSTENIDDGNYGSAEASRESITYLKGHNNIVCSCSWHPSRAIIASGSGDGTVRVWTPESKSARSNDDHVDKKIKTEKSITITIPTRKNHESSSSHQKNEKPSDDMVVSLEWNPTGSLLATGSYNGQAFIWSTEGQLVRTLDKHKAPISAIKWNPSGQKILTSSMDKTASLWNTSTGSLERQFICHQGPVTDLDWRDDTTFALASVDRTISVWDSSEKSPSPSARLEGHADDVSMIKWGPRPEVLASCSDDSTVKVWNVESKSCSLSLTLHTREVCAIEWGRGRQLASAGLDATVRLWDTNNGKCSHSFTKHLHPVSNIAYSPDCSLIASVSHDRVHIWSIKDNGLVRTCKANGGINEISWDSTGYRLAAACTSDDLCILDIRR